MSLYCWESSYRNQLVSWPPQWCARVPSRSIWSLTVVANHYHQYNWDHIWDQYEYCCSALSPPSCYRFYQSNQAKVIYIRKSNLQKIHLDQSDIHLDQIIPHITDIKSHGTHWWVLLIYWSDLHQIELHQPSDLRPICINPMKILHRSYSLMLVAIMLSTSSMMVGALIPASSKIIAVQPR